jgi:hypothetical protein
MLPGNAKRIADCTPILFTGLFVVVGVGLGLDVVVELAGLLVLVFFAAASSSSVHSPSCLTWQEIVVRM